MPEERNFDQPLIMQGADPNKVVCKDCEFRLKMPFQVNGRTVDHGMIKSWCGVYTKNNSNGKPHDVLLRNASCKYYLKEEKDAE